MQLSNTSKYAVRILSFIANIKGEKLQNSKDISEQLEIPYKFLTKIMTELVKLGFVISVRGREGGFKLAREASEITILEILQGFNELTHYNDCILGIGRCNPHNKCILHDKWAEPKKMIKKMFQETTLLNVEVADFKI